MLKAAREAKVHTSWARPEEYYESALTQFCTAVLADPTFVEELTEFLTAFGIVAAGREISLAQTTLLLTCPGVPDIYQGDELWQLTLVDPDNRGAVDFPLRNRSLNEVRGADALALRRARDYGRTKLWLIARLLEHRRRHPDAFESTGYQPVDASGDKAAHLLAFTRGDLTVVVPRLILGRGDHWGDTWVQLPPGRWRDVLSELRWPGGRTWLPGLLQAFPIAVLAREA
jgi:(1->4)-alpha-D-glucan 1-alpha-D-glucosylmutase